MRRRCGAAEAVEATEATEAEAEAEREAAEAKDKAQKETAETKQEICSKWCGQRGQSDPPCFETLPLFSRPLPS